MSELTAGARVRSATARQVALAYDTAVMRRGSFRGGRVAAAGYACHTTSAGAAEEEPFAIRCANRGGVVPFRLGRVMRRRATLRVALRAAVAVGLVLVGVACGGSGEGDEQAPAGGAPSTSTTSSAPGDRSAFCALLAETSGEVDESYLGSAKHSAQLDRLVGAAPDEVRPTSSGSATTSGSSWTPTSADPPT